MPRLTRAWPRIVLGCLGSAGLATAVVAQQNSVHPQPRADRLPSPSAATANSNRRVAQPEGTLPTVPAGFSVASYAELRAPRVMVYAPNGDLFVSSPASNSITVLRDANNDGVFEARGVFADGTTAPSPPPAPAPAGGSARPAPVLGVLEGPQSLVASPPACAPPPDYARRGPGGLRLPFGLAFNGGYLYVGNTDSVVRFEYRSGDLQARGAPEKLLDLPTGGHSTRNIVFNRAGTKLYIAVGSGSNSDAGEDCRRAAILEVNPDGTSPRIYASGIRNPVGLALQPGTDTIWTAVNERDNLGDDLAPDYATSVRAGGFYGWPYAYTGRHYDPKYVGAFPDLVGRAIVPDVLLPAHSAALGITFYAGSRFPARYRNGAFVAMHGSWNRTVASGYRVGFFPMVNGVPGPIEDFVTGFLASTGANGAPVQQWGRPVGVTVAPDGALLVSDDSGNRIWKVTTARPWTPPHTAWGDPDLQGTWTNETITPFERPTALANKPFLTPAEAAALEARAAGQRDGADDAPSRPGDVGSYNQAWFDSGTKVVSTLQSSLVVDPPNGRVPLRPEAQKQRDEYIARETDSFDFMSPWDRCISRGVPGGLFPAGYNNGYQILQGPGYVLIHYEMIHAARIIPTDGRKHRAAHLRSIDGDSVGHWEGNTLVVDITNYNGRGWIATNAASGNMRGVLQSDALHVVERFTPASANTIHYQVTIDDPKTYTSPWTLAIPLERDDQYRIFEYACQEGNHSVENMLRAARVAEASGNR